MGPACSKCGTTAPGVYLTLESKRVLCSPCWRSPGVLLPPPKAGEPRVGMEAMSPHALVRRLVRDIFQDAAEAKKWPREVRLRFSPENDPSTGLYMGVACDACGISATESISQRELVECDEASDVMDLAMERVERLHTFLNEGCQHMPLPKPDLVLVPIEQPTERD
jgi:hypothetical protein